VEVTPGTEFFRTDIRDGMLFRYDGTRWLSAQTFQIAAAVAQRATDDTTRWYWPLPADLPIYLTRWHNALFIEESSTWVATLEASDFDVSLTLLSGKSTSGQMANKMYHYTEDLGIVVDGTHGNQAPAKTALAIWYDQQQGTGAFWGGTTVEYRLIGS
jgi:hypothetical protein